jgi:hypothetical protein
MLAMEASCDIKDDITKYGAGTASAGSAQRLPHQAVESLEEG